MASAARYLTRIAWWHLERNRFMLKEGVYSREPMTL